MAFTGEEREMDGSESRWKDCVVKFSRSKACPHGVIETHMHAFARAPDKCSGHLWPQNDSIDPLQWTLNEEAREY